MRPRNELIVITVAAFFILVLGSGMGPSASAMDCTRAAFQGLHLTDEEFAKPLMNLTATLVPATADSPEYCDVKATMWPEIAFEVMLPTTTWNQRLLMAGNGGKAGTIPRTGDLVPSGSILAAVKLGYAATGTDSGHNVATNPGSTFAYIDYPTPGANPNWHQKLLDFAYRAVHETIVVSKKIVQAYYDKAPLYTYWVGCSQGGRQGLIEAQRYPNDFNGIVAGAPVNDYMAQQMSAAEQLQPQYSAGCDISKFCGGPQIPPDKLSMLGEAVYAKCDGMDGLVDGLIDDPRECTFDPDTDLSKCPGDTDGPACFTTAQVTAIKKIYAGAFSSNGSLIVSGTLKSAEPFSGGWNNWLVAPSLQATRKYFLMEDAFKYLVWETPRPNFNFLTDWNWDTDPPQLAARGTLLNAVNPDLQPFLARGGKLLMFCGWSDTSSIPTTTAIPYYHKVLDAMGGRTKEVLAFYMVPGMQHCSGGIGCDKVDWFTPLVNWVEKGIEPRHLIGTSSTGTSRTRPICRYPEVARYRGAGDINNAANFMCVPPRSGDTKP